MTVPCTRSLLASVSLLTAVVAALSVVAPAARAQSAAPAPSLGAPTSLLPAPATKDESTAPTTETTPPPSSETVIGGIRIDELGPIAPQSEAAGTIDGFGPDLWRGASRALIEAYLPRLPAPAASPVVRDLERRLLLTSAAPPPPPSGKAPESFLARRLERLAAMGDVDDLIALAKAIPHGNDEASVRARIDAAFLAGDDAAACGEIANRDASLRGAFWTRAAVVCDVVGGRTAQAQLALDLMTAQPNGDQHDDAVFAALLRAALGDRKPLTSLSGVGPLEAALLKHVRAAVDPSALADASPLALRTVALGDGDVSVRLDAAERAEAIGAVTTAKLAEIYGAVPFKKDELANALSRAGDELSPRGRALFFQAEQQAKAVPAASAEVLKAALDSAREQGRFAQAARLYAAEIAAIDPAPELAWFADDAARASYAVGAGRKADDWRALAVRGPDGATVDASLWPLATIAEDSTPVTTVDSRGVVPWNFHGFDAAGFQHWLATVPEPDRGAKGALALALIDSLGGGVPPEAWAPFLTAAPARSSPVLVPLARAADGGRIGETVLLTLVVLGSGDADKWTPETTSAAVSALTRINLGADARALAREAAIAADL
jgi:hypothetical protein